MRRYQGVLAAIVWSWFFSALALAQTVSILNMGHSGAGIGSDLLKVIDRKTPADLKGKKVTISRFGSGSDIITRVALRDWKLDPDKDVGFFQCGNTPTRVAALIAGHMDAGLVSSIGVAKIVATGCCRVLADLAELPLDFADYGVVVSNAQLKSQRDAVKRFLQALIEDITPSRPSPRSPARCCARATARPTWSGRSTNV